MTCRRSLVSGLALGCVSLALLATGCGKGAAPVRPAATVPEAVADDVARQFAAALSRQGGLPLTAAGTTQVQALAAGRAPDWAGRIGPAHVETEGSFTWSISITFFDQSGTPQPTYDPLTTARMMVHARAHGTLVAPEHQAEVGTDRTLDVLGLLPAETELHVDGAVLDTAACSFQASDGLTARSVHMQGAGSLEDVRLLKDSNANPYPLSGTARWSLRVDVSKRNGDQTEEAHYEVSVVVTFNGTANPTIEVAGQYRYRMNLETGAITPA